jgi:hypothetical protein
MTTPGPETQLVWRPLMAAKQGLDRLWLVLRRKLAVGKWDAPALCSRWVRRGGLVGAGPARLRRRPSRVTPRREPISAMLQGKSELPGLLGPEFWGLVGSSTTWARRRPSIFRGLEAQSRCSTVCICTLCVCARVCVCLSTQPSRDKQPSYQKSLQSVSPSLALFPFVLLVSGLHFFQFLAEASQSSQPRWASSKRPSIPPS